MMGPLIAFAGSWTVFFGAIYQAALEIREHELTRRRLEAIALGVAAPPRISRWWWLIPPLHVVLARLRAHKLHRTFVAAISRDDYAILLALVAKLRGWLFVASGTYALAVKETLAFAHAPLIVLGATCACAIALAAFLYGSQRALERRRAMPNPAHGSDQQRATESGETE